MSIQFECEGLIDGYEDAMGTDPDGNELVGLVFEIENYGWRFGPPEDWLWLHTEGFL